MNREEMIKKLMWNEGGYGFGICAVANSLMWATDHPTPERPDLSSVVLISSPPEKYTDDELARLVEFSEKKTAEYDKLFRYRRGANLILFDKNPNTGRWMRKRLTWESGPMWSDTLEEAIAVMAR